MPAPAPAAQPKKSCSFSPEVADDADAGERRPKSRRPHNMSVARHLASDNKIADDEHGDHHGKFTLEELQVFKANRDFTHVDPAKLEIYLSVEDFAMYFKMDRVAFDALPNWKKSGLKKTIGIF